MLLQHNQSLINYLALFLLFNSAKTNKVEINTLNINFIYSHP